MADDELAASPAWDEAKMVGQQVTIRLIHGITDTRSETRRAKRENISCEMKTIHDSDIDWGKIAPCIDEAVDSLSETDRSSVLLRFYENRGYSEIAREFGISEDAARMRTNRALERLRAILNRKGIATTMSALAATLPVYAVSPVPAATASGIAAAAITATGTTALQSTLIASIITMNTTAKTAIIAVTAATLSGLGTYLVTSKPGRFETQLPPTGEMAAKPAGKREIRPGDDSTQPGRPGTKTRREVTAKVSNAPDGIDQETWNKADEIVAALLAGADSKGLPKNALPDEFLLTILAKNGGLSEASIALLRDRLEERRSRLDEISAAISTRAEESRGVLQELTALKLTETEVPLSQSQQERRTELETELAALGPSKQEINSAWYFDDAMLEQIQPSLTAEEVAAFDDFVRERREIHLEGYAFERSQRLAEQLQLNSEQRQAVFEQIYRNGTEDPALIAPILDETQREGYQDWQQ